MSKIFLVLFKKADPDRIASCKLKAEKMMEILSPDHLTPSVKVEADASTCLFLFNDRKQVKYHEFSICTGTFIPLPDNWWELPEIPASASLFIKTDSNTCKVIVNNVAGRCTWYYSDSEQFIVSTSQRAIIAWLGSFQYNPQALSWMLATGNLGPGNSWDKRLQHVSAATTLEFDRHNWKLTKSRSPVSFVKVHQSKSKLKLSLEKILDNIFSEMKIEIPFTALTLSGGYDSRTVLYYMVKHGMLVPTVTWGLSSALHERGTDAYVADVLADEYGVPHRFYSTDFRMDFETVFERFLKSGEGRLDHINTFMDGFRMWKNLNDSGIRHIIRADEVFGWLPAQTEQDVRISLDLHKMEDNANMPPLKELELEEQYYPAEYLRMDNESLSTWRDRLYRQFRLPYVLTALHDLIQSYAEVINPFLHTDVIAFCNTIPDELRSQKKLYAEIVSKLLPSVPLARKASIPEQGAILRSSRIVSLMLNELNSEEARQLLGEKFLRWIPDHLFVDDDLVNKTNNTMGLWVKSAIPWKLKKIIRKDLVKYSGDFNQLAFRAVICTRMHRLLNQDANALNKNTAVNKMLIN